MTTELTKLVEAARQRPFPEAEREAQRRSFAYGNTKIENNLITRSMIDEADERIKAELQAR
ncbi:MAG: hypothetical protein M3R43_08930 [Acidobacteriota bacterium]|nr:hypothetical protein [Acidobacteriota bacterium]